MVIEEVVDEKRNERGQQETDPRVYHDVDQNYS